ncbi:titin-like [Rhagoletis pomonella]|uniref:titin-like n=1 Tax=Rhagoletis pomonella TaxID=28610 RepID=UPI001785D981|nr:titin-like [Rhagoletis pomonella]
MADVKPGVPLVPFASKPEDKGVKPIEPISKPDDKPKSPLDVTKPIPQTYSSDESDDEVGTPKMTDVKPGVSLVPLAAKPEDKGVKPIEAISKPDDKTKSPLDVTKPIPQMYFSDESDEEFDQPKMADVKSGVPLVPLAAKPEDKGGKDVEPILKPDDKPKSPLDVTKPIPQSYSYDESDEDFDKPKMTDVKSGVPLVPLAAKHEDNFVKPIEPISKPDDKPKSPLDVTNPIPQTYSSDESNEEIDKPKMADVKPGVHLVPFAAKPEDKGVKPIEPISKPHDKPKSPLDATKPIPQTYSSDESDEEFDKPKMADVKPVVPLVPFAAKPENKGVKPIEPISKPDDKPKSPLDVTKPIPQSYSSDVSDEDFDKPKMADVKSRVPFVALPAKPEDKGVKPIEPISKPEDKPKSPLDATKPIPRTYSSDESDEEFDTPKMTDVKPGVPLVPLADKPEDKGVKPIEPISKPDDKTKSPLDVTKPIPQMYFSDISDEEFDQPKIADVKPGVPLVALAAKPEDKCGKDVEPILKPDDKPKSPLDVTKPIPQSYSSDESDEDFDKPKMADVKSGVPLVPLAAKPEDKGVKPIEPISKSDDKRKSPLDVPKPIPQTYSSDESDEEFDKPKMADVKPGVPLVPLAAKPEDKGVKPIEPISKPDDKPKSPLDVTKPIPQTYSSDEEFDIPKIADVKSSVPFVALPGKPEDKDVKPIEPISKPEDKPKSPLDATKPIPQTYSSDESDEEFDTPKMTDVKPGVPLVPLAAKPEDKGVKPIEPISKPDDKTKSPLDVTKPIPQMYFSDKSDEEFDQPKMADVKPDVPLVPLAAKPEDKGGKDVEPILKPDDKPKSPLDVTKPIPQSYSSDESDEDFDKPKMADVIAGVPLVPLAAKLEDKFVKLIEPILKPDDKPKSPLDLKKPIRQTYSSDESDEEFGKPKMADVELGVPLVPFAAKPEDKGVKPIEPISKPYDKPKSALDATKPIPQTYFSDESDEEFDTPKMTDVKPGVPLVPLAAKPEDKGVKPIEPISKPDDKTKSPLDVTKPVPQTYFSDESYEEFDIPKIADVKPGVPLIPLDAKSEDEGVKLIEPISKPEDKPKSPLDVTKAIPQTYFSDESDEEFEIPKIADVKPGAPLVPLAPKPEDKGVKPIESISKPEDKPKSPLDVTKPIPQTYYSDECDEEFNKPKMADVKPGVPLVPLAAKPEDKGVKPIGLISKPDDKPKSPLDVTKPIPQTYSSDESDEEFDQPIMADVKAGVPLIPLMSFGCVFLNQQPVISLSPPGIENR